MGPLKRDYMRSNITQVVEACLDISFSYSCASLCGCLRGARRQPSRTLCLMNSSTANFNGLLKHSNYKHDTEILWFMITLRTDFIRQTLLIAFSRLFPIISPLSHSFTSLSHSKRIRRTDKSRPNYTYLQNCSYGYIYTYRDSEMPFAFAGKRAGTTRSR